jgi:serine/threonine protein kinase
MVQNRYIIRELLGKGGFSEVMRCTDTTENKQIVLKVMQVDRLWPQEKQMQFK